MHLAARPPCPVVPLSSTLGVTPAIPSRPPLGDRRFCSYTNRVRITYDPIKRAQTLAERGLDFEDARLVFEAPNFETEDRRKDYGESRVICFGMLRERMVVVGYTPRGTDRHVFSMRKANDREQARIAPLLGL